MPKKFESDFIPKSCQENWLEMNPDEQSRFCTLCQKNIFDFSFEKTENTQNICMRYATAIENNRKKGKSSIFIRISKLILKRK